MTNLIDAANLAALNSRSIQSISFLLMNKDKEIVRFKYVSEDGDFYFEEIGVFGVLPIGYTDIDSWIRNRRAPVSRRSISSKLGRAVTLLEYVSVVHAVSLNDTYWIKEESSNLVWRDVSPYTNRINDYLSTVVPNTVTISPNMSTQGMFPKCWINKDDKVYLIKAGTEENNNIEALLEVIASKVYKAICHDAVEYSLCCDYPIATSSCLLITSEDVGMVSVAQFLNKNHASIKELRELMKSFGRGSEQLFYEMLVADTVTYNTDRHLGNIGIYVENDTQKPIAMAKVYDYNKCLLPGLIKDIFLNDADYKRYLRNQLPTLGTDFISVANSVMNLQIRDKLLALASSFELDNLKDDYWRKEQIECFVKNNISILLS